MSQPKSNKILIGMDSIRYYIESIEKHSVSKPMFYKYVEAGMPAAVFCGKWHAYTDNIEAFFKQQTSQPSKEVPEDAE